MSKPVIILLLLLLSLACFASGSREEIRLGNQAYANGLYDEAMQYYEEYDATNPESPYTAFNKGAAFFRKEDFEAARTEFQSAVVRAEELGLEARANYNLGNTAFMQAARIAGNDLEKAVEHYQESISFYKRAIELDPGMKKAAEHNIEITRIILKDLIDKLKEQQQQNEEQQQKIKEIIEKLLELIAAEEQLVDHTTVLNEEKQKQGVSATLRSSARKLRQEQKTIRDKTGEVWQDLESLREEMMQMQAPQGGGQQGQPPQQQELPPDNPLVIAGTHVERAANFQEVAENNLGSVNLETAVPAEKDARDQLIKAVEALSQPQDQQQQEQQQQQQQQEEEEQQEKEQAEDILDEEEENKDKREQEMQGGYYAPLKDW